MSGDFAGALQEADQAVATNGKNIYTYLNRADIYHMQGDTERALTDLQKAKEVDAKNFISYMLAGQIYDELGNTEKARENFAEMYRLKNEAWKRIPVDYLKDIAPKEYNNLMKEKAEAKAKFAKEWKKQKKEKS